jgi:hypothetical protein
MQAHELSSWMTTYIIKNCENQVYGPIGLPFHIYKKLKLIKWKNVTLNIHIEFNHLMNIQITSF